MLDGISPARFSDMVCFSDRGVLLQRGLLLRLDGIWERAGESGLGDGGGDA
jgi:hypothetical protein